MFRGLLFNFAKLLSYTPSSFNTIKDPSRPSRMIQVRPLSSYSTLVADCRLDVLRMVLGNTKWVLDFFLYTLNELFDLADEFESVPTDQEAFNQKRPSTPYYP